MDSPPLRYSGILLASLSAVVLNLFFNGSGGDAAGSVEAAKAAEAMRRRQSGFLAKTPDAREETKNGQPASNGLTRIGLGGDSPKKYRTHRPTSGIT